MNQYQRIFGSGPLGLLISLLLLAVAFLLEDYLSGFQITGSSAPGIAVFTLMTIVTVSIVLWSVRSLPLDDRGRSLITTGAFQYFRHPLYGAFLSFFNFGLAFLLNSWIYVAWAIIQHPIWHWVIRREEKLMEQAFPGAYNQYAAKTGRFFPRMWSR